MSLGYQLVRQDGLMTAGGVTLSEWIAQIELVAILRLALSDGGDQRLLL